MQSLYFLSNFLNFLFTCYTEAENLGGGGQGGAGGASAPHFSIRGGLSPPKLEVVMKNILNTNSLFRMNVNSYFMNAEPPHF